MSTQTNIIIRFNMEGFHNWEKAKDVFPEVGFLSDIHRHLFYFECKLKVKHDDRDKEIILTKREIMSYLLRRYGKKSNDVYTYLHFGSKSCEMLAKELLNEFEMEYCSVIEDNENGGEIFKTL